MKPHSKKLKKVLEKTSSIAVLNAIPDMYLGAVERVMGEMRLDSACEMSHGSDGRFFLNAYSWRKGSKLIPLLMEEIEAGRVAEAVVITPNPCKDQDWCQPLLTGTMCFINHKKGHAEKGACFFYFGPNRSKFISEFGKFGDVVEKGKRRN